MGYTQKLGLLAQSVFQDSSLNVGIGAAPSGTYKLEVTGTAKVSSTLLVSGALTGAAATFSGELSVTSGLLSISGSGGTPPTSGVGLRFVSNRLLIYGGSSDITFQKNSNAGANMTILESGNVGIGTTTPTGLLDVASRGITKGSMPAGTVLQVLQTFKSDLFSTTSGSAVDITGFSVTITPTSSTSKILIFTTLFSVSDQNPYPKLILYRGATAIAQGTAGTNTSKLSMMASYPAASDGTPVNYSSTQIYLDSPATTSAITYKWQVSTFGGSRVWYMNRTVGDVDTNNQSAPSTITVMEIAQ
jgi:hypothetical protein